MNDVFVSLITFENNTQRIRRAFQKFTVQGVESPFLTLHPRVLRQFYQLFRAIPSRVILRTTRADGETARSFVDFFFFFFFLFFT
ncbi:hypothetical protein PUN28_015666 [Cardiocondyla obscurior]|uniref:Uncharacterized protein n=1 Tax=Cardiocondyla obscurior TaxID=286306 RepID=A0AAW2EU87_9HYME